MVRWLAAAKPLSEPMLEILLIGTLGTNFSEIFIKIHTCLHLDVADSKDHGANMGPTWVLSAPGGPHVGPMNLVIRSVNQVATMPTHAVAACVFSLSVATLATI